MQTRDWLSIILIIGTAVAAFFGLKDFVRDRVENLQRQISELREMNQNIIVDYDRLFELSYKTNKKKATQAERDELLLLLHQDGKITEKQYHEYKSGRDAEALLSLGVSLASVVSLGHTIGDLIKSK